MPQRGDAVVIGLSVVVVVVSAEIERRRHLNSVMKSFSADFLG
jgi:hypothetical protein